MIDLNDFARFEAALAADPMAGWFTDGAGTDARAWLAALEAPDPFVIFDNWFVLRANAGNGDCLFHALAGADLPPAAAREVRRTTAGVRRRMPPEPEANALRIIAALLHTPDTRALGLSLAERGLSRAGNDTLAALQAVSGVFTGESEIHQWCIVTAARVLVVDCTGDLRAIGADGATPLEPGDDGLRARIMRVCHDGMIPLFKTPGHWRRIEAVIGYGAIPSTEPAGCGKAESF